MIGTAKPIAKHTTEMIIVHTLSNECGSVFKDDEITKPRIIREIRA